MTEIKRLVGIVEPGIGTATDHLDSRVRDLIATRLDLCGQLQPGTFNLRLCEPYDLAVDQQLTRAEYNDREWLQLQRCRAGGIQAVLVRAEAMAHGKAHLEIMAAVHLRDTLNVSNGAAVVVEVGGDDAWWRAPA